jgi:guanylate kinase
MASLTPGRLVILCGPSCVGKTPLTKSLAKFYPELYATLRKLVLFNSRRPRPGEVEGVDYHFRTRAQVESLQSDERFAVLEVRSDLQALDLEDLASVLERGNAFFEGNPFVGRLLQTHPRLVHVNKLSVFVAPLSKAEIVYLKAPERNVSLPDLVTDIMRRKLLRRTRRQKQELSANDLEDIETRAGSAYREMKEGCQFQYVLPNHDGEDSDNWEAFYYLIGDARKTLEAIAALLAKPADDRVAPAGLEKWDEQLLP